MSVLVTKLSKVFSHSKIANENNLLIYTPMGDEAPGLMKNDLNKCASTYLLDHFNFKDATL